MEPNDCTNDELLWLLLDGLISGKSPSYVQQDMADSSAAQLHDMHGTLEAGPEEYLRRMEPHPVHDGLLHPNDAWRAWDEASVRKVWRDLRNIVAAEIERRGAGAGAQE